ncbi:MAG: nicotinate-nucleotide adenylyltransferase [Tissierellia bacterium]|nr:nicotinate-nucleotide adenylyltransferase [Tissierellia bacterium]
MKIGLLGGTFNPIHMGHLIISEHIRQVFPLDKVIFIPSSDPPHKDQENLIPAYNRYEMTRLAIQSNPCFEISDIELKREGKSYTFDTIHAIKNEMPLDELYFIIGADILYELNTWKDISGIFKKIKFILVGRNRIEDHKIIKKIEEYNKGYNSSIYYIKGPHIEISSTLIRELVKEGKSIKYLVPKEVEGYIIENNLYTMGDYIG